MVKFHIMLESKVNKLDPIPTMLSEADLESGGKQKKNQKSNKSVKNSLVPTKNSLFM